MKTRVGVAALALILVVAILFISTKPILNASGMCTDGAISHWHYAAMEETLAYLKSHATRSPGGEETVYADAAIVKPAGDMYERRSLAPSMDGEQRFLIRGYRPWAKKHDYTISEAYFYTPNCLTNYEPAF